MADPRDIPLARWGEAQRRERRHRLRARLGLLLTAGATMAATAAIATLIWPPRPAFVWNASASSPIGLYRVGPAGPIRPGDMVVAWLPPEARTLAAERRYLPSNVPLVKRVAATRGDNVCAAAGALVVNGERVAPRRRKDLAGWPLPWWTGCQTLRRGEVLLLGASARSFDGRYFGITGPDEVVGPAKLIWPR